MPSTSKALMPFWQRCIKRLMDIFMSLAGLLILSPLIIYVAIRVWLSSRGPVLYSQERIGLKRRKFRIRKFRSMYVNAEKNGPMLSQHEDERITRWGRTMRKWKLDELPQLWNVLIGEMSFVGPRPEREYYILQLEKESQSFSRLLQVKPGITSLGMVKFGYAATVAEMVKRMKYDIFYLEHISLAMDMKIIGQTFRIIFMAKGR